MSNQTKYFGSSRNLLTWSRFILVLLFVPGFTPALASTYLPPNPPNIVTMPMLTGDAIPVVAGHQWKKTSTSSRTFVKCMVDNGVESKYNLRIQWFSNDIKNSLALVAYAKDLTARPTDVADVLQTCLNGVENPTELNIGGPTYDGANVGFHNGVRAYAAGRQYFGVMIFTYWAQVNAPIMNPLPVEAMADRAQALDDLAKVGVTNPKVVNCKNPGTSGFTTVPSEVRALVNKLFAKSKPLVIYKNRAAVVDLKTESSVPHICIYSWGGQGAYGGSIPTNATRAIEVGVQHANNTVSGGTFSFAKFAFIPGTGWKLANYGTSP